MSQPNLPKLTEIESRVKGITLKNHQHDLVVMMNLLNTYIDGFNMIDSFTLQEDREIEYAWILLLTRSFHSMRSAMLLIQVGYYTQAMMLLRSVTENWLICKDCQGYRPTLDALLYGKHRLGNRKLKLQWIDIAERVGAKDIIYEQDYRFQSRFNHPDYMSLGVVMDPDTNEMRTAPAYDRALFLCCFEMMIRNAMRMTEFIESFLSRLSESKVVAWRETAGKPVKEASDWLAEMQEKHGSRDKFVDDEN
jgi:hypothetical protein